MIRQIGLAPGCRGSRSPGAVLLAAASAGILALACEPPVPRAGPVLELNGDTVQLEPGASVLESRVAAVDGERFEPATLEARPGDAIRFVADDSRTHAIAFDAGRLAPEVAAYLQRTDQLRGPPLVNPGATWIVSLAGAPAGVYPFACVTHGGRGTLLVDGS